MKALEAMNGLGGMATKRRKNYWGMLAGTAGAPIGARMVSIALRFFAPFCGQAAWGAAAELPAEQVEFFEAKVRPILVEACYKCHSVEAKKSKGDLFLDSRDASRKGGASGAAVIPGKVDESLLIQAIRYKDEDLQMPPADEGGKLSDEKIAILEQWVKMGAPDPRVGGKPHPMDMAEARKHWAFQPVVKPAVPQVAKAAKQVATPVDAFVIAKLEEKNLGLAPAADKRTLLRRVTYDLTGLPPTPEEMDAFVKDGSPEAYAKVVDRLLASPRYGERWGRFWLDVARFADTKGYLAGNVERRYPFSHTYRDYVIRAFNEDKPFDQFIVEQIAADHLPLGEDKSALAALGYLTLGRRFLNNQNDIIDDRIDVVTRGLMGLTVSCARCHDHKFDPIPTKDYYSLHGVFASSEEPEEKPLMGPLVESPAYKEFLRKQAEVDAKIKARGEEEVDKFLATARGKTGDYLLGAHEAKAMKPGEKLDTFAGSRKLNPEVLTRWRELLGNAEKIKAHAAILGPWQTLEALPSEGFAEKAGEAIAGWQAEGSGVNARVAAGFVKEGKPVAVASLKEAAAIYNTIFGEALKAPEGDANAEALKQLVKADDAPPSLPRDNIARMVKRETDNKTAPLKRERESLNWTEPGAPLRAMALVDKAKPANTRVFIRGNQANRGPEAQRQFLEILSGATREPFKKGSGRLELAQEIASAKNPLTARVLVNRVWGWHFGEALVRTPSDFGVRTEAPVHRELLDWLAASFVESGWSVKSLHRLIVLSSTYRQGSAEIAAAAAVDPDNRLVHRFNRKRLELEAMRDTLLAVSGGLDLRAGGLPDDLTKEPFSRRRTVYGYIDRQNLPGMFRTFDYPNPDVSSAGRFATTVPQQALYLMNSPFAIEQARALMARPEIAKETSAAARVKMLYRLTLQREPEKAELELAQAFVAHAPEGEVEQPASAGWAWGRGTYDAAMDRVRDFAVLAVRDDKGSRVTPGAEYPDTVFGYLSVTSIGGHPGKNAEQGSVRRWTAPADGTVKIDGSLAHPADKGDGVRGRIVSSANGKLGEWTVQKGKAATALNAVQVKKGETIDFIVDPREDGSSDTYAWTPTIAYTGRGSKTMRTWNAKKDFESPEKMPVRLTRWEEFAQVLLVSNEVAFVD